MFLTQESVLEIHDQVNSLVAKNGRFLSEEELEAVIEEVLGEGVSRA